MSAYALLPIGKIVFERPYFHCTLELELLKLLNILAGVPQSSDIAPFLYNIFAHDIPKTSFTELGSYADDTEIVASNENPIIVFSMLQRHPNIINLWIKR